MQFERTKFDADKTFLPHKVYLARQTLDDEYYFFRPLRYREITHLTFDNVPPQALVDLVQAAGNTTQPQSFHLRTPPPAPEVSSVKLTVNPPKPMRDKRLWQQPLDVTFEYLAWQRHDDLAVAFVPTLELFVLRRGLVDANFVGQLKKEIRQSLVRSDALTSLSKLVWVAGRADDLEIQQVEVFVDLKSPRQLHIAQDADLVEESTLSKVAQPLELKQLRQFRGSKKQDGRTTFCDLQPLRLYEFDDQVEKLADLLSSRNRRSVLITGAAGCGKSSLVSELAQRKSLLNLEETEFWGTDGSRIVAGMSGYGQWQERCTNLVNELKKRSAVLHLGNLVELLEVGKSVSQSEGIASFLRIFMQRGTLQATAECTTEQLAIVEQRDPQLLQVFERLPMKAPNQGKSLRIFRTVADNTIRDAPRLSISEPSLATIYRLHRRYATYSDNPGRPIRFLRNLIQDTKLQLKLSASNEEQYQITSDDVLRAFAVETGLPYFLLGDQQPLDLTTTRDWFAQRVIGQTQPVQLVCDLLATVKAGLTPTGRPVASCLFIGPTGVGKTQMAKSLAEFMYGDQRRLIRFDMSEFRDRLSVERLIGGVGQSKGLLTSQVRQHPFSVVLFDEFEKADRSFFDLLLQVLGEGRLTDGAGRTTDFSTVIVVMTSNLGVESFKMTSTGFSATEPVGGTQTSQMQTMQRFTAHFSDQVEKFIRPELFNRIDRIVPFMPLSEATVEAVVRSAIEQLKKREGIWFRAVDLSVDDATVKLIAAQSRDPRYGARPIQRHLQQHLATPLSDRINKYKFTDRLTAQVSVVGRRLNFEVKAIPGEPAINNVTDQEIGNLRNERRRAQNLFHSAVAQRFRNQYFREKQLMDRKIKKLKKHHRQKKLPGGQFALYDEIGAIQSSYERKLAPLREQIDSLDDLLKQVCDHEDQIMQQYFQKQTIDSTLLTQTVKHQKQQVNEMIYRMFLADTGNANTINLIIYSRYRELANHLIRGYVAFAKEKSFSIRSLELARHRKNTDRKPIFSLASTSQENGQRGPIVADVVPVELDQLYSNHSPDRLGCALQIKGQACFTMLSPERGLHLFKKANTRSVAVEAVGGPLIKHDLMPELESLTFDRFEKRRTYNLDDGHITDELLDRKQLRFHAAVVGQDFHTVVEECVEANFQQLLARFVT